MGIPLPDRLADKAAGFPESSYGATTVALVLEDGARVAPVVLAWGREIVKVHGHPVERAEDMDFDVARVRDVEVHR